MKKFKLFLILILTSFLLMACSNNGSETEVKQVTDDTFNSTQSETSTDNSSQEVKSTAENNTNVSESTPNKNEAATESTPDKSDISSKTKDYILNGQEGKSEAEKIKWSETFLNHVNIDDLYQEYISAGGTAGDIKKFAEYLTLNAPIPDNWRDLVATDLLNIYDVKISRIEHLQDDIYQVYVEIEGSEVPYVVVNSRTGYFHG
ncbi:MAG: hypothetical protein ACYDG2_01540 [Ruminiclostridium sp.]